MGHQATRYMLRGSIDCLVDTVFGEGLSGGGWVVARRLVGPERKGTGVEGGGKILTDGHQHST